jgi:hypothetical protein
MTAIPKPLAIAFVTTAALAALNFRSDVGETFRTWQVRPNFAAECHGQSATCMVEINYAYPGGDLSVVPPDVYF